MPKTAENLAAARRRCNYVEPPQDLADATIGKILERDPEWNWLLAWFRENTSNEDVAFNVFLAERYGQTISEVYCNTDSFLKRADPDYVNYN